jgi:hypothetical protein
MKFIFLKIIRKTFANFKFQLFETFSLERVVLWNWHIPNAKYKWKILTFFEARGQGNTVCKCHLMDRFGRERLIPSKWTKHTRLFGLSNEINLILLTDWSHCPWSH